MRLDHCHDSVDSTKKAFTQRQQHILKIKLIKLQRTSDVHYHLLPLAHKSKSKPFHLPRKVCRCLPVVGVSEAEGRDERMVEGSAGFPDLGASVWGAGRVPEGSGKRQGADGWCLHF